MVTAQQPSQSPPSLTEPMREPSDDESADEMARDLGVEEQKDTAENLNSVSDNLTTLSGQPTTQQAAGFVGPDDSGGVIEEGSKVTTTEDNFDVMMDRANGENETISTFEDGLEEEDEDLLAGTQDAQVKPEGAEGGESQQSALEALKGALAKTKSGKPKEIEGPDPLGERAAEAEAEAEEGRLRLRVEQPSSEGGDDEDKGDGEGDGDGEQAKMAKDASAFTLTGLMSKKDDKQPEGDGEAGVSAEGPPTTLDAPVREQAQRKAFGGAQEPAELEGFGQTKPADVQDFGNLRNQQQPEQPEQPEQLAQPEQPAQSQSTRPQPVDLSNIPPPPKENAVDRKLKGIFGSGKKDEGKDKDEPKPEPPDRVQMNRAVDKKMVKEGGSFQMPKLTPVNRRGRGKRELAQAKRR